MKENLQPFSHSEAHKSLSELSECRADSEELHREVISGRKALQNLREEKRTLFEFCPHPLLHMHRSTRILNANRAAAQCLESLIGEHWPHARLEDWIAAEDVPRLTQFMNRTLYTLKDDSEPEICCALRSVTETGKRRIRLRLLHSDHTESKDHLFAMQVDKPTQTSTTEKTGSAQNTAPKQRCLICALDITGDSSWAWDVLEDSLEYSDRFAEENGYAQNELPQSLREYLQYIHPRERVNVEKLLKDLCQSKQDSTLQAEYRLRDGSGEYRWMHGRGKVVEWSESGEALRVIVVHSDVSARKEKEIQLEETSRRLRDSQMLARMGDWRHDLASGKIEWSEAVFDLFGRDPEDGPPAFEENMRYYTTKSRERMLAAIERVKKTGNQVNIDLEVPCGHDHKNVLSCIIQAVENEAGEVVALKGTVQDVSRRKRAEKDRERMIADLESANKELERFTYTVSHDLRSPLITIEGFVGQLEDEARKQQFDLLHEDIGRINKAVARMQRLLDELLELSRVGRLDNPREEIHLSDVARTAVEICSGRLKARNVRVHVHENLPVIKADKRRFLRLFQNLIDNAAKYMGEQPEPRIEIFMRKNDRHDIICVRDNGIGIEPEHHDSIFQLFDQLATDSEGTGLGLSLVQRIVHSHGGRIWVESEGAEKGSTFCMVFP